MCSLRLESKRFFSESLQQTPSMTAKDDGDFVFAQTAYKFDVFSYSMILISRKQSQIIMDLLNIMMHWQRRELLLMMSIKYYLFLFLIELERGCKDLTKYL